MRGCEVLEIEVLVFDVEGLRDTVLGKAMILQYHDVTRGYINSTIYVRCDTLRD